MSHTPLELELMALLEERTRFEEVIARDVLAAAQAYSRLVAKSEQQQSRIAVLEHELLAARQTSAALPPPPPPPPQEHSKSADALRWHFEVLDDSGEPVWIPLPEAASRRVVAALARKQNRVHLPRLAANACSIRSDAPFVRFGNADVESRVARLRPPQLFDNRIRTT